MNLYFYVIETGRAKQPIELASNLRLPDRNRFRRRDDSVAALARLGADIEREHVPIAIDRDDDPATRRHARHFRDSIGRGIDIFKDVFAPDAVERTVGKRDRRKRALHELRRQLGFARVSAGSLDKLAAEQAAEQLFLELLDEFGGQGRNVSHIQKANNYAPTEFAKHPKAKAIGAKKTLAEAMERLFAAKKIKVEPYGSPSKGHHRIARCNPEQKENFA